MFAAKVKHLLGFCDTSDIRSREASTLHYKVVVPVEIEIDSMLYNLIQSDIPSHFDAGHDMPFQECVNICFKERMEQIITDPKEFGKLLLNQIRRNHCMSEVDLEKEGKEQ